MGLAWIAADGCDNFRPHSYPCDQLFDLQLDYVDTYQASVPSARGAVELDEHGELGDRLRPPLARDLADWLDTHADELRTLAGTRGRVLPDVGEAAAWLRWAAEFGEISL
jgi:hypothetical protein